MSKIQWEYDLVERPFCEQLRAMGWQWIEGDTDVPDFTERQDFREVLLKGRLAEALRKLNPREGQPWLDGDRIRRIIEKLEKAEGHRLMEINESANRARAAQMQHAARYHIIGFSNQNPAYARKMSERLEEILRRFKNDWDALERELRKFIDELRQGDRNDFPDLDPKAQVPFVRLMLEQAAHRCVMNAGA